MNLDATIFPRPAVFYWKDKSGQHRRPVHLNGIWLGARSTGGREIFIPVETPSSAEPEETAWGIQASHSNLPKIVANAEPSAGWIGVLSGYAGPGHAEGHVLVSEASIPAIQVLAHGISSFLEEGMLYHEFLVRVSAPAEFRIWPTSRPDIRVQVDSTFQCLRTPLVNTLDTEDNFVNLTDERIARWPTHRKIHVQNRSENLVRHNSPNRV